MMKQSLVIGYGNTLRSDDGAGQKVAEIIAELDLANVRSLAVHQLTPELANDIAKSDLVIFVDASARELETVKIQHLIPGKFNSKLGHNSHPSYLLTLTQFLYNKTPLAYWLLIPASNFEFGEIFSTITEKSIDRAVKKIQELVCTKLA